MENEVNIEGEIKLNRGILKEGNMKVEEKEEGKRIK